MCRGNWLVISLAVGPLAACSGGGGTPTLLFGELGLGDPRVEGSTPEDIDGDGVLNPSDNCPSIANGDQSDVCDYPTPPSLTGDMAADGLARLNYYRGIATLPPVVEVESASDGCRQHLEYLVALSEEIGSPQLTHDEDLTRTYASAAGHTAAQDSILIVGTEDIIDTVDSFMNSLYHRLPLLSPGLRSIGIHQEGEYGCILYRRGMTSMNLDRPVRWPAADLPFAPRSFGGVESPCPTSEDAMEYTTCPPSATIATLSLFGATEIENVTGSYTRLDTLDKVPLLHVYFDQGPTEHEQMGFLPSSIALVPEAFTELVRAPYEVEINATIDGADRTYRWRFGVAGEIPEIEECDFFGAQGSFAEAVTITTADNLQGRVCENPDFFYLRDQGTYEITLEYDPLQGSLDIYTYNTRGDLLDSYTQRGTPKRLMVDGMIYFEIRGKDGDMGPYLLDVTRID